MKLCLIELDFLERIPIGKKDQKWSKMAQKHGFGTFLENHAISFV